MKPSTFGILLRLWISTMLLISPALIFSQEKGVNQKRIEKERKKKQKKAVKEYEAAVKQHKKNQSKQTKTSMKRTKKESKKMTPVRP